MYHFFVEKEQIDENSGMLFIDGDNYNHIVNVLRMKVGDEISVSPIDGDGRDYRYGIEEIKEGMLVAKLRFIKEDGLELSSKVYLFQGLPKADKMELIIQKAVELGVYEVIPVKTKRAVVKLDEKRAESKRARWNKISEAAAKQSKRRIIPNVSKPISFKEAIDMAKDMNVKLIPYELADDMNATRNIIDNINAGDDIAVFIGPEGGFDDSEIELAKNMGVIPITMGKRILRTETAGFTILAWLNYVLEAKD